jgi:hypothetical protein
MSILPAGSTSPRSASRFSSGEAIKLSVEATVEAAFNAHPDRPAASGSGCTYGGRLSGSNALNQLPTGGGLSGTSWRRMARMPSGDPKGNQLRLPAEAADHGAKHCRQRSVCQRRSKLAMGSGNCTRYRPLEPGIEQRFPNRSGIAADIDAIVTAAISTQPVVVVAHSLGPVTFPNSACTAASDMLAVLRNSSSTSASN